MQNLFLYTQGSAGENTVYDLMTQAGWRVDYWNSSLPDAIPACERIIVYSRDPIGAVLDAYAQQGYTQPLSAAHVGERVRHYCESFVYHTHKIVTTDTVDGYVTRLLALEDHPQTRHWQQSLGVTVGTHIACKHRITTPNAGEIARACEQDLAVELEAYRRAYAEI